MNEMKLIIEKALPDIARRRENELILVCPVDKGFLRWSIKVRPASNGIGLIIRMLEYGKYVEFGTPPHVIKPKDKQALKFKSGKKIIFSKKVNHPGTRPNPFIRNTIQEKLGKIIGEEINRNI